MNYFPFCPFFMFFFIRGINCTLTGVNGNIIYSFLFSQQFIQLSILFSVIFGRLFGFIIFAHWFFFISFHFATFLRSIALVGVRLEFVYHLLLLIIIYLNLKYFLFCFVYFNQIA